MIAVNLTFLNPFLLWTLPAVLLPMALHLLGRHRSRPLPFSTLFFLRRVDVRTARRHKLVDLFLLFLRTLLILLVILALAGPVWRPGESRKAASGKASRVILIDDSFSTRLRSGGRSLFERELEFARSSLEALEPGDEGAIVFSSGIDVPPTGEISRLVRRLSLSRPSFSGGRIPPALERAVSILADSRKPVREIVIVSDMQKNAFLSTGSADPEKWKKADPFIFLCPVPAGSTGGNLSLTGADIHTPLPLPGMPFTLEAVVKNRSSESRDASVSLWYNGEMRERKRAGLPPSGRAVTGFSFTPRGGSGALGKITLEQDILEPDNVFYYHLPLIDSLRLLLVSSGGPERMETDGSLFLSVALWPLEQNPEGDRSSRLDFSTPRKEISLEGYSVVIFTGLPETGGIAPEVLKEYLVRGGGALFFLGSVPPGSLLTRDQDLFPFEFLETWEAESIDQLKSFGGIDRDHPLMNALSRISGADLSSLAFFKGWKIRLRMNAPSLRILASTRDEKPILLENTVGRGKILYFLSSPAPEWSDMGTRPAFLPFLYEAIKHVAGSRGGGYLRVGDLLTIRTKERIEMTTPDEEIHELEPRNGAIEFRETFLPGHYRWEKAGGGKSTMGTFSVNIDPDEGDLTAISLEEATRIFPEDVPVSISDAPGKLATLLEERRRGRSLSGSLLLIALVAFLLECLFANRLIPKTRLEGGEEES